jgi:hypothetical protein
MFEEKKRKKTQTAADSATAAVAAYISVVFLGIGQGMCPVSLFLFHRFPLVIASTVNYRSAGWSSLSLPLSGFFLCGIYKHFKPFYLFFPIFLLFLANHSTYCAKEEREFEQEIQKKKSRDGMAASSKCALPSAFSLW